MKKLSLFTATMIICLSLVLMGGSSCERENTSDVKQGQQQEKMIQEATAQTGMPAIVNFQERKMMKMILELRDKAGVVNYCYLYSDMTGKLIFIGKCIGYGLPYATQYTNPMKPISGVYPANYQETVIPQSDPNGLFMPASADGTWVMLINPKTNEPEATYIEPRVIISHFPLTQGL